MKTRIVTDEDVDKALAFLRDSAVQVGAARKADVRCSDRWLAATADEARAAGEYEKLKALREAAAAKIEAWRSESANYRGMRV